MKPSLPLTRTPSLRRTTSPVRSTGTGRRMCPRTQVLDLALPDDAPENEHRTETARAARACPAQRGGRRCAPEGAPVRRTGQRRGDAASARLPAARSRSGGQALRPGSSSSPAPIGPAACVLRFRTVRQAWALAGAAQARTCFLRHLARLLPLLPQQAGCSARAGPSSSLPGTTGFPQLLWITPHSAC